MTAALVPMKDLQDAKRRLSSILFEDERRASLTPYEGRARGLANARNIIPWYHRTAAISTSTWVYRRKTRACGAGWICARTAGIRRHLGDPGAARRYPGGAPFEIDALATKQTEPTVRPQVRDDGTSLMISPPKLIETTFNRQFRAASKNREVPVRMSIQFKARAFPSISIRRKI